jgi:maltose/moltooligosaccharide transporter
VTKYFSKPHFFYLAILSFGINLGFTFELNYLSSIFKFFDAETYQLSYLWLVPPTMGLIVQPLIGQISDGTSTRWGKRRPYIIVCGILAVLSFFLLSSVTTLFAAAVLILILNIGINGCVATLLALTTDMSTEEERSKAFALQAFMAGIGSALAVGLPYLMNKLFLFFPRPPLLGQRKIPANFELSFITICILMTLAIFISIRKVKEPVSSYKTATKMEESYHKKIASYFRRSRRIFIDIALNLKKTSTTFKRICCIHSLACFGVYIFFIYFTTVLTQNFYSSPTSEFGDSVQSAQLFQQATLDASKYLSIGQYVTVLYSLFLFFLLEYISKAKLIHGISLLSGGIGMAMIGFAHTHFTVLIAMIGVGIMNGSLATLSFTIVSRILPKGKSGVYFGIFNISVTVTQIFGGLLLSPVYRHFFGGHTSYMLLLSAALIIVSASLWLREAYRSPEFSVKIN